MGGLHGVGDGAGLIALCDQDVDPLRDQVLDLTGLLLRVILSDLIDQLDALVLADLLDNVELLHPALFLLRFPGDADDDILFGFHGLAVPADIAFRGGFGRGLDRRIGCGLGNRLIR